MMLLPPEMLYYALIATCFLIPMGLGVMYSMAFFDFDGKFSTFLNNLFDKSDDT